MRASFLKEFLLFLQLHLDIIIAPKDHYISLEVVSFTFLHPNANMRSSRLLGLLSSHRSSRPLPSDLRLPALPHALRGLISRFKGVILRRREEGVESRSLRSSRLSIACSRFKVARHPSLARLLRSSHARTLISPALRGRPHMSQGRSPLVEIVEVVRVV